jgi:hypothetical protein
MREVAGNIWEYDAQWICITTNGIVGKAGAVMGDGVGKQAAELFPSYHLRKRFGQRITAKGNIVQGIAVLPNGQLLVAFPVKHHWKDDADLDLIERSAEQLRGHWDAHGKGCVVVIPRPGCGNGRLLWEDVKPRLLPYLEPENFHIIDLPPAVDIG